MHLDPSTITSRELSRYEKHGIAHASCGGSGSYPALDKFLGFEQPKYVWLRRRPSNREGSKNKIKGGLVIASSADRKRISSRYVYIDPTRNLVGIKTENGNCIPVYEDQLSA